MAHPYVLWIPFKFPPENDIILDAPMQVDVSGYRGEFKQHRRFKGLEIVGLPSEDAARKFFRQVTAALLFAVIGRGPVMRFDLELVPTIYKKGDPIVYWKPASVFEIEPQPFDASRAVIYRSDKQITIEGYMKVKMSSDIKGFAEAFQKGLVLPSLEDRISKKRTRLAAELYCLGGFELSDRAHFLTLCTVLEVLARRTREMDEVVEQIDGWRAEARVRHSVAKRQREEAEARGRGKEAEKQALQTLEEAWARLAERVGNLKTKSITSALKTHVEQLLKADGRPDAASHAARVAPLYDKRSRLVHGAQPISKDEIFELDEIVRMTLVAAIRNTGEG